MNYVGVDNHKKYSVLCALDEGGRKLREARSGSLCMRAALPSFGL
jgi:hypothetical protein